MLSDFRLAIRSLRATPGFTVVALVVLTLGIGATTAIFSVVDAVVLRSLPFDEDDRLVLVEETNPTAKGLPGGYVNAANFIDWRAAQQVFVDMAAYQGKTLTLRQEGEPENLRGQAVSASLFPLLRVGPRMGRTFTEEHQVAGRDQVAVLSDGLWKRRFGADPAIVGKTVTFDQGTFEIVGVMAPGFTFPVGPLRATDLWVPWVPSKDEFPRGNGDSRNYNAQVVARLKDGTTIARARAQMEQITAGLKAQYPRWFRDRWVGVTPLHESVVGRSRAWMLLLLGAVAFVLLIACVNVANLMLARATAKTREVSVRAALGATRWQLARGLLAESLVLSIAGTALGVGLALWGVEIMRASLPPSLPRLAEVGIDLRVLATAAGAAVVTGLLFGVLPAWQASRPQLSQALREGGRSGAAGLARERARTTLLVAEVALAVVLLVGAGLFVSSFVKLTSVDLGIAVDNTLSIGVYPRITFNAPDSDAQMARAGQLIQDVHERLRQVPGVEVVAFTTGSLPLNSGWSRSRFKIPGKQEFPDDDDAPDTKTISPEYFKALGVPLLAGRIFTAADSAEGAAPVVILNDVAAARYFGGADPLGVEVETNGKRTVVGVVKGVRLGGPEAKMRPEVYLPFNSKRAFGSTFVIRTPLDPARITPDVRSAIHAVIPELVIPEAQTFRSMYDRLIVQRRFNMIVIALFGALAVVIAAVGIYGVMAYIVEQRTQEIGVRMALGAQPGTVLRMVLVRASVFMGFGLAIGLAAGWVLSRLVQTFLFQVEAHDVRVYSAAAVVLILAGLAAAFVPARRASNVDPMRVLR